MPSFWGKYRAQVTGNQDPLRLGRVQVVVPGLLEGIRDSWAMPCTPYAGAGVGFYAIPPVGANVWVEFEGGDPSYPIWSGCFWAENELPPEAASPDVKLFKTQGFTLAFSEQGEQPGLKIEVSDPVVPQPLTLTMMEDGIRINNQDQTVVLIAPQEITISVGENTSLTLRDREASLVSDPLAVELHGGDQRLALNNGASTASLTADAVRLAQGPAALNLGSNRASLENGSAQLGITPVQIELDNGPAGNLKVTLAGINLNNGALEVI